MASGVITQYQFTRLQLMTNLNLGWSMKSEGNYEMAKMLFRDPMLQVYSNYLNNEQYKMLPEWQDSILQNKDLKDALNARKYQPRVIYPLPRIAANVHTAHLVCDECQLKIKVEEENLQDQIDDFIEQIELWPTLESAIPDYLANGSMFLSFRITKMGKVILTHYNTKWVHPVFDDDNELESVTIRYIYETDEYDPSTKKKVWKWRQYKMFKDKDIMYDEPKFETTQTQPPKFTEKETYPHGLGFVQGVWIKTTKTPDSHEGISLLHDSLDMIDNLNYLISKQGVAIDAQLLPFLIFQGDGEEMTGEIQKNAHMGTPQGFLGTNVIATGLPKQKADMHFLESNFIASKEADVYVTKQEKHVQRSLRIVEVDPSEVASYANQSGVALRMLFKPVIEYVRLRRPFIKKGICDLLEKNGDCNKQKQGKDYTARRYNGTGREDVGCRVCGYC